MFGTIGFAHISKVDRKKWDAKAKKVYLVGFEPTQKNFRLYDPEARKVIVSCDVKFNENFIQSEYVTFPTDDIENSGNEEATPNEIVENSTVVQQAVESSDSNAIGIQNVGSQTSINRASLRHKPKQVSLYDADRGYLTIFVEPTTYDEAMQSEHSTEWKRAINDELQSLSENDTWDIINKPDDCTNVVGCKWVFKVKMAPSEDPKFKA